MSILLADPSGPRYVEPSRLRMFVYFFRLDRSACLILTRIYSAVLLIRTYAFFNRNVYILWFLLSALSGVVAYQLYVDTTQMQRTTTYHLLRKHPLNMRLYSASFLQASLRKPSPYGIPWLSP